MCIAYVEMVYICEEKVSFLTSDHNLLCQIIDFSLSTTCYICLIRQNNSASFKTFWRVGNL